MRWNSGAALDTAAHSPKASAAEGAQGRVAALDGLRGLAVAAVLGYHLKLRAFEAGFLGVDLFFVISGFIITARLLNEHKTQGRIDLLAFYQRRVWRLYPAALLMILLAFPLTAWLTPDALARLAADAPAAFLYLSNLWQLWSAQSYFESMGRDPVLRHLWSLAVEQHYYLFWPAVAVLVLKRSGLRGLGLTALALALASTLGMAALYLDDPSSRNTTYLATPTHAMGLFLGSALGGLAIHLGWPAPPLGAHAGRWRTGLSWAGAFALVLLGAMVWGWNEATPALFLGGFLLASALAAVAIAAALWGAGALPRLLGSTPLRWLGTRSYSIYLWHWPICVWVFGGPGDMDPGATRAVAVALVSALAGELSYRWIEQGARRHVLGLRERYAPRLTPARLWLAIGALIMGLHVGLDSPPPEEAALASLSAPQPSPPEARTAPSASPAPESSVAEGAPSAIATTNVPIPAPSEGLDTPTPSGTARITTSIIGDSVMASARHHLARSLAGVSVDAAVGRQFHEARRLIVKLRENGLLGPTVVLHLGTNGYIVESHLREVLRQLQDRQRVVLVDVHAARRWTEPNNQIIARVSTEFPNVVRLGWEAMGRENPEYFIKDGIHPTAAGIDALALAVARAADVEFLARGPALRASGARPTGSPGAVPKSRPTRAVTTDDSVALASKPETESLEPSRPEDTDAR